jgi:hypothetical protein
MINSSNNPELVKLISIFEKVDAEKQKLVEKTIEHTVFLSDELDRLKVQISNTGGMVRIHPDNPNLQKPTEVGKQYLKTLQAYNLCIKTLNSILSRNQVDEEDGYDQFIQRYDD